MATDSKLNDVAKWEPSSLMRRFFDDSLLDDFFRRGRDLTNFPSILSETFHPKIDVHETPDQVVVSAEVPGVDEKDLELTLQKDSLIVKGEKKSEKEEKNKNFHRVERTYGSFQRMIRLPCEVDESKAQASFKQGVLTVTLPKTAELQKKTRKIEIKTG